MVEQVPHMGMHARTHGSENLSLSSVSGLTDHLCQGFLTCVGLWKEVGVRELLGIIC